MRKFGGVMLGHEHLQGQQKQNFFFPSKDTVLSSSFHILGSALGNHAGGDEAEAKSVKEGSNVSRHTSHAASVKGQTPRLAGGDSSRALQG